jgi:hypothetical protein
MISYDIRAKRIVAAFESDFGAITATERDWLRRQIMGAMEQIQREENEKARLVRNEQ